MAGVFLVMVAESLSETLPRLNESREKMGKETKRKQNDINQ